MDKNSIKIGEELRRITHTGSMNRFPVMSGVVVADSFDSVEMTCTVRLSVDDTDSPTPGVQVTAALESTTGVVLYPANNANVLVCEVDGPGSQWAIIMCDKLMKASITIGSTEVDIMDGLVNFNGGGNNGLVKVAANVNKLNALESDLNNLKTAFATLIVAMTAIPISTPILGGALATLFGAFTAYSTAAITPTVQSDLENTAVKH